MALILNLDDDPELLVLNRLVLERLGHSILGVTNSQEALRLLRSEPVDLFIQDMKRPDIGGETFYSILKEDRKLRQIPVLILSGGGYHSESFGLELLSYGDRYLAKPYNAESLIENVIKLLARHRFPDLGKSIL
jgi:DNA-binding response OmpR family regulator